MAVSAKEKNLIMSKLMAATAPQRTRAPVIHLEPGFAPSRAVLRRLRSTRLEAFILVNIGFWTAFAIADLWCRHG